MIKYKKIQIININDYINLKKKSKLKVNHLFLNFYQ